MLCFASNYIVGRLAPREVPPIGRSFWRWVVAAIIILPFLNKSPKHVTKTLINKLEYNENEIRSSGAGYHRDNHNCHLFIIIR